MDSSGERRPPDSFGRMRKRPIGGYDLSDFDDFPYKFHNSTRGKSRDDQRRQTHRLNLRMEQHKDSWRTHLDRSFLMWFIQATGKNEDQPFFSPFPEFML
jgi:hypothetical protein